MVVRFKRIREPWQTLPKILVDFRMHFHTGILMTPLMTFKSSIDK